MKIEEFRRFAIKKIDAYRIEELKTKGYTEREFFITGDFRIRKLDLIDEFVRMFYDCKFECMDSKINKNIGNFAVETETILRFDNNKKVYDLWNKDKKNFNETFGRTLGNYVFNEIITTISLTMKNMQLPFPIASPFAKPLETTNKK